MDMVTGWIVGVAVFVLGGVVGFFMGHLCGERRELARHMQRAPLAARMDCLEGRMIGTNVLGDEARAKLDELAETVVEQDERIAVKATEAETRVTGLVNRVVELEKRGTYDDGELRTGMGKHLIELRLACEERVEGLRKRTSEKFGIRDRKIEDLYGRVGVLIERTDVLAEAAAPKPCKSTEHSTAPVEKKPSRKRNA